MAPSTPQDRWEFWASSLQRRVPCQQLISKTSEQAVTVWKIWRLCEAHFVKIIHNVARLCRRRCRKHFHWIQCSNIINQDLFFNRGNFSKYVFVQRIQTHFHQTSGPVHHPGCSWRNSNHKMSTGSSSQTWNHVVQKWRQRWKHRSNGTDSYP